MAFCADPPYTSTMSAPLLAVLLAVSAWAGGSGLMVIPESSGEDERAPAGPATAAEAEARAKEALAGHRLKEAGVLYGRAVELEKDPRRKARLLLKHAVTGNLTSDGGAMGFTWGDVGPAGGLSVHERRIGSLAEQALRLDPKLAMAKLFLAMSSGCRTQKFHDTAANRAACERALRLADQAVRMDPRSAYARYVRLSLWGSSLAPVPGSDRTFYEGSIKACRALLPLAPEWDRWSFSHCSNVYFHTGRRAEWSQVQPRVKRAQELLVREETSDEWIAIRHLEESFRRADGNNGTRVR